MITNLTTKSRATRVRLLIITQAVDRDDPILGFFHRWVEEFAKHCEHIHVICLKEGTHRLSSNVTVYPLGKSPLQGLPLESKGSPWIARMRYVWRFYKYIWSLRKEYDAVFIHMNPEYAILGGFLWRIWGKRISLWYVHKSVTWRLRIGVIFTDIVFTAVPESFRLASDKVIIVGHGIPTDMFLKKSPGPKGELRIVTVGRISKSKRIIEMLSVLDALARENVLFSFTIAGAPAMPEDFAYEARLKAEVASRPYVARVRFLGGIPHRDLPSILADADIFLNLSKTGGVDKAVLEAMAAGVVPVTTNTAFRSILGPLGLFSEKDSPDVLASAILRARDADPEALRAIVEKDYSLAALIPKILSALAPTHI
mgnify:CR=1 FL=1